MSSKAPRNPNQSGGIASWIPWVAAIVVIAAVAIVAVVSAKGSDESGVKEWEKDPEVEVEGDDLPPLEDSLADAAVGMEIPEIRGVDVRDGEELTIGGDDGKGKVIVITAHWCPTCQSEVPKIVDHLKDNPLPDDVELVSLTTSVEERRGNYPPSDWLTDVGWKVPTIIDDSAGTGGMALGITGFPSFIVVDADNRVVARTSGAVEMAQLDIMIDAAAGRS